MTVLIVDDYDISARVIEMLIKKNGFEAVISRNAKEALDYFENAPLLTAAIVDIMMPEMDGFALVHRVREMDAYMDLPIVMCSVLSDQETIQRCSEQDLKYYVLKPVNEEEMIRKLRMAIEDSVPIREVKPETIRKLGVDGRTYDATARTFAKALYDTANEIELQLEEKGSAEINILNLDEGVAFFGGTRLANAIEGIRDPGSPMMAMVPDEANAIVEEMRILQRAIIPVQRTATI